MKKDEVIQQIRAWADDAESKGELSMSQELYDCAWLVEEIEDNKLTESEILSEAAKINRRKKTEGAGEMKTIDGKPIKEIFEKYRDQHIDNVIRDKYLFTEWYDKAGEMVLSGKTKAETVEALAPWGCAATQSNGVLAGACQASRLLRFIDETGAETT